MPYMVGGGGGVTDQLPTFDAESKSAKIPNSLYNWRGRGNQLSTFDAESKSAKIRGGGGVWISNF